MKFKLLFLILLFTSLFSIYSAEIDTFYTQKTESNEEEIQQEVADNRPIYLTRFIISNDITFSPYIGDGLYIGISPGMIFEPKYTYKVYQPAISLDIGYNRVMIPNRNLMFFKPHSIIYYNAIYTALRFRNRFLINEHNTIFFDIFTRISIGGKYKITDGGSTSVGINVGYYYFFNEHVGLGTKIEYAYYLSGNNTGHNLNLLNIGVICII